MKKCKIVFYLYNVIDRQVYLYKYPTYFSSSCSADEAIELIADALNKLSPYRLDAYRIIEEEAEEE